MAGETLGRRLRRLRGNRTQLEVSKAVGINNSVLSRLETDDKKTIDPSVVERLADYFDVSIDYLWGRTDDPTPPDGMTGKSSSLDRILGEFYPVGEIVNVPVVAEIPCGTPAFTEDNIIGYHPVDTSIVNLNGGEFVWVKAKGESMIGANILDGSLVLLRLQPEVESGQIAAVCVDEENATLKRVYYVDGNIMLVPENPGMRPTTHPKDKVRVVARAMRVSSELL